MLIGKDAVYLAQRIGLDEPVERKFAVTVKLDHLRNKGIGVTVASMMPLTVCPNVTADIRSPRIGVPGGAMPTIPKVPWGPRHLHRRLQQIGMPVVSKA